MTQLRSVELFAGAGGLALGVGLTGVETALAVEWDANACASLRLNAEAGSGLPNDCRIEEGDIRTVDFDGLGRIDLVTGGPPCQPFSISGKHRGYDDTRDMFPAAIDVIRRLRPRAFILENVKGLTRPAFRNYLEYIKLRLEWPDLVRRPNEEWQIHLARLERARSTGNTKGIQYRVVCRLVDAADYGVPQRRSRVFFVGFRSDVRGSWSFPDPTHSLDALLHDQWVTRDYWRRVGVRERDIPAPPDQHAARIATLRRAPAMDVVMGTTRPWRTVREAIAGLPEPTLKGSKVIANHILREGARAYVGHTGSPLDLPAKALKAGDHGVPGGENMMVRADGSVRYFTAREAARLQTFPDGYELAGPWSEAMRQLGNAVPVRLARIVAASVVERLIEDEFLSFRSTLRRMARA